MWVLVNRGSTLGHGHTLCQAPELRPWPEEVRVWLPFPQLHPVAVAIEILVPGREGKGNKALIGSSQDQRPDMPPRVQRPDTHLGSILPFGPHLLSPGFCSHCPEESFAQVDNSPALSVLYKPKAFQCPLGEASTHEPPCVSPLWPLQQEVLAAQAGCPPPR